jgi:glycogen operon protein
VPEVATRLAGSSDLYQANLRQPINSVNFVTCHDGFTLWDLVSYERKYNLANREDNRDGTNEHLSWNCGVEGESSDLAILTLRRRQARNLLTLTFLSQGIPMLLAGDEVLRTQYGNNNTWCQDNPLGWFDWTLIERNAEMLRFVRGLIALRQRHPSLCRRHFLSGRPRAGSDVPDVIWHGLRLEDPPWDDPQARLLAFTLARARQDEALLHVMINMDSDAHRFEIPAIDHTRWSLALDTGRASPMDLIPPADQRLVETPSVLVRSRSIQVLEGR